MIGPVEALIGLIVLVFWILVFGFIVFFIIKLVKHDKYSEDSVIQRWGTLLTGQAELSKTFLDKVVEKLEAKSVSFGNQREFIYSGNGYSDAKEFLVVRLNNDYSCYVSTVTKGTDLVITWLIQDHMLKSIHKMPIIGPILIALFKKYNIAKANDVIAFAMVTQDAVMSVVEEIMDDNKLDKTKLKKRSSGKLGLL